jgi:hypothetical protein
VTSSTFPPTNWALRAVKGTEEGIESHVGLNPTWWQVPRYNEHSSSSRATSLEAPNPLDLGGAFQVT